MTEAAIDRPAPRRDCRPRPSSMPRLEKHRVELTGYCYRMLGSAFEAEDAVQETFIRAWRGYDQFEGRAAFRSWLYRIATNVCFDMKGASQRRARPIDLNPAVTADTPLGTPLAESDLDRARAGRARVPSGGDPADVAVARESIRLAFVAALQHLPPQPAGGPDPARGPALEGRRGRRAPRHERSRRSTARSSGPGRRSPRRTSSRPTPRRPTWTTSTRRCSGATSPPSSSTTWMR